MIDEKLFGIRLKQCREERNLTVRQLAEEVGISGANISRYENNVHGAGSTVVRDIAKYFGINPSWLMGDENADKYLSNVPDSKSVPILGKVSAGFPMYVVEDLIGYEFIPQESNIDFCLRVKGDSMINACIHDGNILYIRKQSTVDNGNIAVVVIDGEEATVKRFYKLGNQILLKPENPAYKDIIIDKEHQREVKIIGKVISVKFDLEG